MPWKNLVVMRGMPVSEPVEKLLQQVVDAVNDLTRVTVAIQGNFGSRAEAVRKLHELSIPPARIANILAMPLNIVHSTLTKAKQRSQERNDTSVKGTGSAGGAIGDGGSPFQATKNGPRNA
jgi:hypothetical protein